MPSASEVSAILGKYMLSGWVLTDINCSNSDCSGCPLMRSRDGRSEFCARCDGGPVDASPPAAPIVVPALPVSQAPASQASSSGSDVGADDLIASHVRSSNSRPSTPPTPLRSDDEDPEAPQGVPIADAETLAYRRNQSDLASKRIGDLLIKGWAMLDAHCPGEECWGVPLMRSPKGLAPQRQEQPKKGRFCVICEKDWDAPAPAIDAMRSISTEAAAAAGAYSGQSPGAVPSSSVARRKRPADQLSPSASTSAPAPHRSRKAAEAASTTVPPSAMSPQHTAPLPALRQALTTLTVHLESLSQTAPAAVADVEEIARSAEAVERVWNVLRAVERSA